MIYLRTPSFLRGIIAKVRSTTMLEIIALSYISFSELQKVDQTITPQWAENNTEEFNKTLYSLGMDTSIPYDWQRNIPHRNRFNEVVTCDRIVGNERTDKEWINSGYASQEAIDKSKHNKILVDLYRMKGLVESVGMENHD